MTTNIIILFLFAILSSMLLAKMAIRICHHFEIIDYPGSSDHKKHEFPTPLAGGITIALCLALIVLVFRNYFEVQIYKILAAAIVVFVFGLIDDMQGKAAAFKFFGQLGASLLLIIGGIKVAFIVVPNDSISFLLNSLLTIFWLIGITNAYNMIDSMDGLAAGLAAIGSIFILVGATIAGQSQLMLIAVSLVGIYIGVLFFNLPPARLFLGDSGAQTSGFILAALAILYSPESRPQASSWFVPITFMAIPIFDVCLVFFSRIRRGKPFYLSDLNHSYHRLVKQGLSKSRAIWLLHMVAIIVSVVGLFALHRNPVEANLIFVSLLVAGILVFFVLDRDLV